MVRANERDRLTSSLRDERDAALLYRSLAEAERDPALQEVYRRLAATEARHADLWRDKLQQMGVDDRTYRPRWRTRVLSWLARRFGPGLVLPAIIAREQADRAYYEDEPVARAAGLPADERAHARLFAAIGERGAAGLEGGAIARLEGRHRASGGNALRAAVLGANDGLVSNLSLVMGVAGADLAGRTILITGLAGLLAGSLSMAMGEWLSVQSARELYEHQIGIEREELEAAPQEEAEELALIYQAKGVPGEQARLMAGHIVGDREKALDTLAREELGIDPAELGGSAWVAAGTSFALFSIGAIVPVIPYFLGNSLAAVLASIALSVLALFLIGAAITVITGRNALASGLRQVAIGVAAAAITFGLGRVVGGLGI